MNDDEIFRLEGVTLRYRGSDIPSLNDVSWRLSHSDLVSGAVGENGNRSPVAIVGWSGSGKTTLLNLLGLLLNARRMREQKLISGNVKVFGKSLFSISNRESERWRLHEYGFALQSAFLLGHFTGEANVLMPLELQGLSRGDKAAKLSQAYAELQVREDFAERLRQYPAWKLSGGEKQRVAVLRAVIHNPSVLFADEPTNNLDPENAKLVMNMLFNWGNASSGRPRTLVFVTHDLEAASRARCIIKCKDGKIEQVIAGLDETQRLRELREFFHQSPI